MLDFWDFAAFWEFFNPFGEHISIIVCPSCGEEFNEHNDIEVIDKERKICKCPKCGAELKYDKSAKQLMVVEDISEDSKNRKSIDKEAMEYIRDKLKPARKALDIVYQNNEVPKDFIKKAIEDWDEAIGMLTEKRWKFLLTIILKCKKCGYTIKRYGELDGEDIYYKKCGNFMTEERLFDDFT